MEKLLTLIEEASREANTYLKKINRHKNEVTNVLNHLESAKQDLKKNDLTSESIEWLIWYAPRYIYDGFDHKPLLRIIEQISEELKKNMES